MFAAAQAHGREYGRVPAKSKKGSSFLSIQSRGWVLQKPECGFPIGDAQISSPLYTQPTRPAECRLTPGMTVPKKGAAIDSVKAVEAEWPRVIAKGRVDDDAHRRRGVIDRRWRRVVVRLPRSVLRLHHLGAGVRARRGRKPDCRNRQCNHNQFLPHDRYPPVVFGLNLPLDAKLQTSRAPS